MAQLATRILSLLALYSFLTADTSVLARSQNNIRKFEDHTTTSTSRGDFLDGLVDQILEQSRSVLVSETPRITREVSSTSTETSWNPADKISHDSLTMITESQDLDDKHIHYDTIPGQESSTEPSTLSQNQEMTTQRISPVTKEVSNESLNLTIPVAPTRKEDTDEQVTPSDGAGGGRNSLARSINHQNDNTPMKPQQQLTRPPYAASDQFQMRPLIPNRMSDKLDNLNNDQLIKLSEMSMIPQAVASNLDFERLYFSKDQLLSSTPSTSINPSRAHNDRYTDEFQNIISPEMQSVDRVINNQLQNEQQPESRNVNNFAASFVNITAPIGKPLSASEAMKAEILGSNKAIFLQQQHQASGYKRAPTAEPSRNTQHDMPPVSHYYTANNYDHPPTIYSAPANQFPIHQLESPIESSSIIATSGQDKERMRLEPQLGSSPFQNSQLTERRPYGPQNMTGYGHQASGFRSPLSWHHTVSSDGHQTNSAILNISPTTVAASIMNATYPQTRTPPSGPPQSVHPTIAPSGSPGISSMNTTTTTITTNGFITSGNQHQVTQQQQQPIEPSESMQPNSNRRQYNLTRVEHISAECSNDLIRTLIVFNGTFKGIIYSSGYVRDPNCMYINGTGKTRYEFSIRLNQCGTLSRQEVHSPSRPSDISRQDKIMWNTLSIQYNPIIEQEWDEHFRVSCEYGSDFWKTISFSPFNVETNTGSPVVFTVDPPQCQMEVLRGYGVMGPRQEAVSGPVTVGDPLTLLIHMRSEKAGYDILVKNCIAHNGGTQKMQLIDSNGCVVNERFISPFRGNYNDNELKHVTLYSFLKAFRFTGSPVLYLECEIHMCQNKCPPQMCYWRRLSKRSIGGTNDTTYLPELGNYTEPTRSQQLGGRRSGRNLKTDATARANQMSDKVNLFQALEVRHDVPGRGVDPDAAPYRYQSDFQQQDSKENPLLCYRRAYLLAFLFGAGSIILVAISVVTCCWRATSARMAHDLVSRQLGRNGMFLTSECGSQMDLNKQADFRFIGQRKSNLLNVSHPHSQKTLNSMNPMRHQIGTSQHRERLLSGAGIQ